jgi:hypothetical protein
VRKKVVKTIGDGNHEEAELIEPFFENIKRCESQ